MAERIVSPIFDETFDRLQREMQIATLRQSVIAQNIANAKTPGYIAKSFDEELMKAVERLDSKDVVLEQELADLADNQMKYTSYVKIMTSKLNILRSIATQGRR